MNTNELEVIKIVSAPRETLFKYFTDGELLEQWAYPEGMTLKIPKFEAKVGGRYRYEHTLNGGVFVCEGRVTELVPDKKLVQLDEFIDSPEGKRLAENLENIITFEDAIGGTEVTVITKGNMDEKVMKDCETGWKDSFDHLKALIARKSGVGVKGKLGELRT